MLVNSGFVALDIRVALNNFMQIIQETEFFSNIGSCFFSSFLYMLPVKLD